MGILLAVVAWALVSGIAAAVASIRGQRRWREIANWGFAIGAVMLAQFEGDTGLRVALTALGLAALLLVPLAGQRENRSSVAA